MSATQHTAPVAAQFEQASANHSAHLYNPAVDFLLLGGGSLLPLLFVYWHWPHDASITALLTSTLVLANLINHPHFAHSYQLFYANFKERAFGKYFPPALRFRYLFASLAAPILLIVFFAYCVHEKNALLMGRAANLMLFLVGWHYVKQGYGILMVDAALKRSFFNAVEKKILLTNAYAVWILSYILANSMFYEKDLWGLKYYSFAPPDWMHIAAVVVASMTGTASAVIVTRKIITSRKKLLPISGLAAYAASLYVWLLIRHPAMLLVIPAFHSLQYLAVVWRYRINYERAQKHRFFSRYQPWASLLLFSVKGFILGYLGFWLIPEWLDANINFASSTFGSGMFLFMFWIFINVHHYFIDNVLWRKDNPDTRRYLFQ